jgi:hypothetical protein
MAWNIQVLEAWRKIIDLFLSDEEILEVLRIYISFDVPLSSLYHGSTLSAIDDEPVTSSTNPRTRSI